MTTNPKYNLIFDEHGIYSFQLSDLDVSIANALRRTIISDIPTVCFITENELTNECTITENTTRFHNEILKHRLSCIPVFEKVKLKENNTPVDGLTGKYVMELHMENDGDTMIYATTEHFKLRNKATGEYMTKEETRNIFPPDPVSNQYIDFIRLRPPVCDTIPGEKISLSCEFNVSTAKKNSCFNVVSKCSYANTPDKVKIETALDEYKLKLKNEGLTNEEIEFQKKNFLLLDSQRYFTPNSFDYVIQSLGIYENHEVVKFACSILINKFKEIFNYIEGNDAAVMIEPGNTTIENCFDVRIENEDYTVGKVIEYFIYEKHYMKDKTVSYCGFQKQHPHDEYCTIRIAFTEKADATAVRFVLKNVCNDAVMVFANIKKYF